MIILRFWEYYHADHKWTPEGWIFNIKNLKPSKLHNFFEASKIDKT